MAKYTEDGKQVPDPTPVAIPVRFTRQSMYNDRIRELVRSEELARLAQNSGKETFEEANDFNVGDDVDQSEFGPGHEEISDPVDDEVINRLTRDEYARKVEERFQQLEPLVNPRSNSNGDQSNKGRPANSEVRSKRSGKVDESKSKSSSKSSDKRSVREADTDNPDVEE